jgi:hypothetical protein
MAYPEVSSRQPVVSKARGPPCEGNKEKPGKKGKTHRSAKEDATLALLVVVDALLHLGAYSQSSVHRERERERERGEEREKKVSTTRSFPQRETPRERQREKGD